MKDKKNTFTKINDDIYAVKELSLIEIIIISRLLSLKYHKQHDGRYIKMGWLIKSVFKNKYCKKTILNTFCELQQKKYFIIINAEDEQGDQIKIIRFTDKIDRQMENPGTILENQGTNRENQGMILENQGTGKISKSIENKGIEQGRVLPDNRRQTKTNTDNREIDQNLDQPKTNNSDLTDCFSFHELSKIPNNDPLVIKLQQLRMSVYQAKKIIVSLGYQKAVHQLKHAIDTPSIYNPGGYLAREAEKARNEKIIDEQVKAAEEAQKRQNERSAANHCAINCKWTAVAPLFNHQAITKGHVDLTLLQDLEKTILDHPTKISTPLDEMLKGQSISVSGLLNVITQYKSTSTETPSLSSSDSIMYDATKDAIEQRRRSELKTNAKKGLQNIKNIIGANTENAKVAESVDVAAQISSAASTTLSTSTTSTLSVNDVVDGLRRPTKNFGGLKSEVGGLNGGLKSSGGINNDQIGGLKSEVGGLNCEHIVDELLISVQENPGNRTQFHAENINMSERSAQRKLGELKLQGKIEYKGCKKTGGYYVVE